MKKTKLTRSLLAACSIVALSAVMYGCTHSSGPSQDELDAGLQTRPLPRPTLLPLTPRPMPRPLKARCR